MPVLMPSQKAVATETSVAELPRIRDVRPVERQLSSAHRSHGGKGVMGMARLPEFPFGAAVLQRLEISVVTAKGIHVRKFRANAGVRPRYYSK